MPRGNNFLKTLFIQKSCFDGATCLLRLFFAWVFAGCFRHAKTFWVRTNRLWDGIEKQKSSSASFIYNEGFVSKRRFFDLPECRDCSYKDSSYCGGNAPLTSGNETGITEATAGLFMKWKRGSEVNKWMTCEEYREKCLNETPRK